MAPKVDCISCTLGLKMSLHGRICATSTRRRLVLLQKFEELLLTGITPTYNINLFFFSPRHCKLQTCDKFRPMVPRLYKYLDFSRPSTTWNINQSSPNNWSSINKWARPALRIASIYLNICCPTFFFLRKIKIWTFYAASRRNAKCCSKTRDGYSKSPGERWQWSLNRILFLVALKSSIILGWEDRVSRIVILSK